jgi:hypothetical protein
MHISSGCHQRAPRAVRRAAGAQPSQSCKPVIKMQSMCISSGCHQRAPRAVRRAAGAQLSQSCKPALPSPRPSGRVPTCGSGTREDRGFIRGCNRGAIGVQSGCNRGAIGVQSGCNQGVFGVQLGRLRGTIRTQSGPFTASWGRGRLTHASSGPAEPHACNQCAIKVNNQDV